VTGPHLDVDVRWSKSFDVSVVAEDMRQADINEIFASSGWGPREALNTALDYSTECFTVVAQSTDLPLAMFGYRKDDIGSIVWMLGTNQLYRYRMDFLRKSRKWCDYLQGTSPLLYNLIDQRNTAHIRWLEWLGFKFVRTIPEHGHLNLPFIEFVRVRHV
jgi:hypothetical protein